MRRGSLNSTGVRKFGATLAESPFGKLWKRLETILRMERLSTSFVRRRRSKRSMANALTDPNALLQEMLVKALPAEDLALLRRAAVLRYITPDLARTVTEKDEEAKRLLQHPLLRKTGVSSQGEVAEMPLSLRQALLAGSQEDVAQVGGRLPRRFPREKRTRTRDSMRSWLHPARRRTL